MSQYFPNGSTVCPIDSPYCGACVYWSGRRNVMGDLVEYDINDTGMCNNIQSPAYGQDVGANHGCGLRKNF